MTFNHVFYTGIIFPHRDYFNVSYFNSFYFIFDKFSSFGMDCFIILEAIVFSYKLISYIKKKGPSFITFFKFYLLCLPKITIFLIIYFYFVIEFRNISLIIETSKITFHNILLGRYRTKICFANDPYMVFRFWELCSDLKNPQKFYLCFRFVHVCINLILSYTIFIFIFYLSFKIKNKIFDNFIAYLIITLNLLSFFYFDLSKMDEFNFSMILGEELSFKFFPSFVIKYFIGILGGLFYFYSNETIQTNSILLNKEIHCPFRFVYQYIIFLNIRRYKLKKKKNQKALNKDIVNYASTNDRYSPFESDTRDFTDNENKYSVIYTSNKQTGICSRIKHNLYNIFIKSSRLRIMAFSFFVMFFLCFYPILKLQINSKYFEEEKKLIKFSWDLKFLYIYERNIFALFYTIFITGISLSKNISMFKVFPEFKLFIILGRINFAYFLIMDSIIYFFFTVYDIEFYFSYLNTYLLSVGLLILVSIFSLMFTILFEFPIRRLFRIFKKIK